MGKSISKKDKKVKGDRIIEKKMMKKSPENKMFKSKLQNK